MLNRDTLGALIFLAFFTAYAVFAWQIPLLPFEEMDAVNSASIPKVYAVLGLMFSALTFAIGEYLVPFTETQTALFKVAQSGGRTVIINRAIRQHI